MNATRLINRSKVIFLGLFVVVCGALWAYQLMYAIPAKKCEAAKKWWYAPERACGTPIDITTLTGRPRGSAEEVAAQKRLLAPADAKAAAAPSPQGKAP